MGIEVEHPDLGIGGALSVPHLEEREPGIGQQPDVGMDQLPLAELREDLDRIAAATDGRDALEPSCALGATEVHPSVVTPAADGRDIGSQRPDGPTVERRDAQVSAERREGHLTLVGGQDERDGALRSGDRARAELRPAPDP